MYELSFPFIRKVKAKPNTLLLYAYFPQTQEFNSRRSLFSSGQFHPFHTYIQYNTIQNPYNGTWLVVSVRAQSDFVELNSATPRFSHSFL